MKLLPLFICATTLFAAGCQDDSIVYPTTSKTKPVITTLPLNGDFERGDENWIMYGAEVTTDVSHSDYGSVHISNSSAVWSSCDQYFEIPEGAERLTLSGWIKTENVIQGENPWESAQLSYEYFDSSFSHLDPYPDVTAQVKGTTEWTHYTKSYSLLNSAYALKLTAALGNATGDVWFDDLSVTFTDSRGNDLDATVVNDIYRSTKYFNYTPENHSDQFITAAPSNIGANDSLINELVSAISEGTYGVQNSLLIMQNDTLVVEKYFNEWTSSDPHQLHSVTKNFISVLAGVAIKEGFISSVHDPIKNYLPEYEHLFIDGRENITIQHLLTMSAGLDWDEWSVDYSDPDNSLNEHYKSSNSIEYVLTLPMVNEPGSTFSYSGGFVTVMEEIISNSSGMSLEEFATQYLFIPIDAGKLTWKRQIDLRLSGLNMRPRDMLKLGELMLNEGEYQGSQIITPEWVTESMANHISIESSEYGYYWWRNYVEVDSIQYQTVRAGGSGGQYILTFKELDLVVVMTAENFGENNYMPEILEKYIVPAFL